jgi:hypothetical protein
MLSSGANIHTFDFLSLPFAYVSFRWTRAAARRVLEFNKTLPYVEAYVLGRRLQTSRIGSHTIGVVLLLGFIWWSSIRLELRPWQLEGFVLIEVVDGIENRVYVKRSLVVGLVKFGRTRTPLVSCCEWWLWLKPGYVVVSFVGLGKFVIVSLQEKILAYT